MMDSWGAKFTTTNLYAILVQHEMKVGSELKDRENFNDVWWLEAVHHAEQNKDFSHELIRKIEEAVSGNLNNSKSRVGSRYVVSNSLHYIITLFLSVPQIMLYGMYIA